MNRLTKELYKRNILLFDCDRYIQSSLFTINNNIIVTIEWSELIGFRFYLYDRHLNCIGAQDVFADNSISTSRRGKFHTFINVHRFAEGGDK